MHREPVQDRVDRLVLTFGARLGPGPDQPDPDQLRRQIVGNVPDPPGQVLAPLVLLEGGNLDLQMWDLQFTELASKYRVIRYDVRGFGRSGAQGASYLAHEDLLALLDHLSIEQAHLVGLSLGGRIAVDFAHSAARVADTFG